MRKILMCGLFSVFLQNVAAMNFNPFSSPTPSSQDFLSITQVLKPNQITQNLSNDLYHEIDVVELIKLACLENPAIQCLDCITEQILLDMLPRLVRNGIASRAQMFFVPILINRKDNLLANGRQDLDNHFVGIAIYTQAGKVTQIKYLDSQGKAIPNWLALWLRVFFQKDDSQPINITAVFTEQLHPQITADIVNCGPFLVQAFAELALGKDPTVKKSGEQLRSEHIQQLTAVNKHLQPKDATNTQINDFTLDDSNQLVNPGIATLDRGVYTGETLNGLPYGQGTIKYRNGDVYKGAVNCKPDGKGVMQYTDGSIYDGSWINGKRQGYGILANKKLGVRIDCYWENDKPSREAVVNYPNGDIFAGAIANDLPNGLGEKRYANGNKYQGMFVNGRPEGQGEIKYSNGDVYTGEFCQSLPCGNGTMKYKNGDVYEGLWLSSTDGQGTVTFANGNIFTCKWQNGKPIGSGVMIYENGDIYEGPLLNGMPHGYGSMEYADGNKCTGNWRNGKFITESEYY